MTDKRDDKRYVVELMSNGYVLVDRQRPGQAASELFASRSEADRLAKFKNEE